MGPLIFIAIIYLFKIIRYAIIASAIISWLPISRDNPLVRLLYQITEPILAPIRRLIERSSMGGGMMFDFSPIVAFLLLAVIENILIRILAVSVPMY